MFKLIANVLAVLFLVAGTAWGQGVGASGDIKGTVMDASNSAVAGASVTAVETAKGIKHTATTDSDGQYHLTRLLPAVYSLSVSSRGFQTAVQKNVILTVGQTVVLDFHLNVSQVSESVEVSGELPVVETERGHQEDTINEQSIRELPINRRDYLTFTLLAPGVSDSTRLPADQDFRVKQTPQSGLSFYGSNGRGNSVTVDGGEVNDDSGGVRLNVGQEAVQEFQINRSNYGADLGGANGATINIVTKSGSNQVHGSLFSFFRNDALDARNPFAFTQPLAPGQAFNPAAPDIAGQPVKDSLSRYQYGGSVGFPVVRDKTFVFAAFEGLLQDAQNAVPLFTNTSVFRPTAAQRPILTGLAALGGTPVPCLTGQPALPAAVCAAILQNILTINPATSPLNRYIVNQFENNGGLFDYRTRSYYTSGRFDHQFSDRNQAFLRYSYARNREESPDVQSLVGFSAGSSIHTYDNTLQGAWFHQFSPRTQNEARVQWSYSTFDVIPNAPGTVGINVPGYAFLGANIFLPSRTIMRRYEFADNVSLIRGHHSLKFGGYELVRGNHTESHTFLPGRFQFGSLPGGILSPCLQVPVACGLPSVNPTTISPLQSVSLGLPQFYQQGFGSPIFVQTRPWTAFYGQDSWTLRPNFTFTFGARYELDSQSGKLHTSTNNVAPRVSFAWDPWSDHKTVVRGGYGIFYSSIYQQIPNVVQTMGLINGFQQIAQVFVPLTGQPGRPALTSAAIFQTLFAQGRIQCTGGYPSCITPADLVQFGIGIRHDGTAPLSVFFSGQPDYRNPYSQQAEFGIERQITKDMSVSVSGIYVHTIGLPVSIDTNLRPAPFVTATLATGQQVSYRAWNAPACTANPFSCFVVPTILQNNVYSSRGSALYEGGILEVKKRFSNHYSVLLNYTFSKAFSNSTDFNSDFSPVDQTNLNAERGLSDFDQRHKLVIFSAIGPWESGKDASWGARIFSGFQLAPIFRYNSGHPFNLLAGTDVNGDRHSTNDRPIGAGHNTGHGPDFISFDLRVTRHFRLTEKVSLQVMAEGFNIFNRTNYASVNNVVGANFGLLPGFTTFNVQGSAQVSPSAPLGFTSTFPKRQLQFGARLSF